jgi:hypothetical protein
MKNYPATTRVFLGLALLSLFCLNKALSAPLSELQASNAVLRAFTTPYGFSQKTVRRVENLTRRGSVVGYVVDLAPSGYYLVSTDDELPPWKLRSDEGSYTNLPPWLISFVETEMAEDQQALHNLRKSGQSPNPKFHQEWQASFQNGGTGYNGSGPVPNTAGHYLLSTTWDTIYPYNFYCPNATGGSGGRANAGCSACALAQILAYHTQPNAVAQDHEDITGPYYIHDAGMEAYDWADMPNAISDTSPLAQQEAVGQLMYHAAVALDSLFQVSDTGADPTLAIPNALQTYFKYTSGAYQKKSDYTDSQWYNTIVADIDSHMPVLYTMFETGLLNGHAVVCDGYDGENVIHLNLGWSGVSDAWYNFDSIVVTNGPTTYHWTIQGAVFGITPPAPAITSVSPATLPPSASPQTITITGTNFNYTGPNASTLVFYDPGNNSSIVTPNNATATSLQYNLTVGSAAGTWKVKVVNGNAASSPYTFAVSSTSPQLTALSISGPANVPQNTSGNQYTATAIFSDGSTSTVTPTWGLSSGAPASISSSGQLTANSVGVNTAISVTASYTFSGVTKTASYGVRILTSGNCGYYFQELISNGSFSNNSTGWTLTGNFQADSRFPSCHSCPGYAYLANFDGTPGNSIGGALSQTITIPADATSATLGYYYYITTSDSLSTPYDHFYLNLVLPEGTLVGIDQKSNTSANSGYAYSLGFDVSAYRGETVTVKFSATNDVSGPTVFRVDDVSLLVLRPNPVTNVLFGVGGPTNVVQGGTAQYNAIVVKCDGSVQSVTPTWSITSGPATINSSGVLTAGSVSVNTPATVSATYSGFSRLDYPITIVHVAPVFTSLAISGPNSTTDNSSNQFTASAIYSDGSSQPVSPSWSITSGPGNITSSGLMTIGQLGADATTTVSASATIGGITKSNSQSVTVVHVVPSPSLTSLSLSGPSLINGGSTAQYSATAWFSDGSSQAVNPFWSVDSGAASVSLYGLLSAGGVTSNTPITVSASYTVNAVTRNASTNVTIQVVQPVILTAAVAGKQVVLKWPTNDSAFKLFYVTNLSTETWISNPVIPAIVSGQYTITNSMTNQLQFYRLEK